MSEWRAVFGAWAGEGMRQAGGDRWRSSSGFSWRHQPPEAQPPKVSFACVTTSLSGPQSANDRLCWGRAAGRPPPPLLHASAAQGPGPLVLLAVQPQVGLCSAHLRPPLTTNLPPSPPRPSRQLSRAQKPAQSWFTGLPFHPRHGNAIGQSQAALCCRAGRLSEAG